MRGRAYRNSSTTPSPSGAAIGSRTSNRCCWSWPPAPSRRSAAAPDAGQVAVELGREKAGPAHLAVGDDVDPAVLLVAERGVDRVVVDLAEVHRPELAALGGATGTIQPGRACEPTTLVGRPPAAADGRGSVMRSPLGGGEGKGARRVVHEEAVADVGASRLAPKAAAEPVKQVGQAGRAAVDPRTSRRAASIPSRMRPMMAVLDRPLDQAQRTVGAVPPAERLVVLGERAGREELRVIPGR